MCIDTQDKEEIIRFVKLIQPNCGAINIEDTRILRQSSTERILTQPTPIPSAHAANHMFCIAQQTLYSPVSGIDVLPKTKGPNFSGSYVTQILMSDSKIPSNFRLTYLSYLSESFSSIGIDFCRSFVKDSLTFIFVVLFFIKIKS